MYKQQCIDWGASIRAEANKFYTPRIQATEALIEEAKARGEDPANVKLQGGIATIDYLRLLDEIRAAVSVVEEDINKRVAECDSEAVPDWLSDPQKVSDYGLAIAMLPFVALTKNYGAAHVDLAEIYKGKPLGGDNALIPKARDDVLNALGIGGDVAKFMKDPVNSIQDLVSSLPKVELPKVDLPPLPNIPLPQFPPAPPIPLPQFPPAPPIPLPQFPPIPNPLPNIFKW